MKNDVQGKQQAIISAVLTAPPDRLDRIFRACTTRPDRRRLGTVRQAAAILDCHPRTVQRYARRGMLNPIRITCRRVRFDLAQVERLATEGVCHE